MRKKTKKRSFLPIVVVLLVGVCAAFGVYITGNRPSTPASPTVAVEKNETPPAGEQKMEESKVYSVVVENNRPRLQSTKQSVPSSDPIQFTLNKLVEQGSSDGTTNPIPKGTKLLGVDVKDGLAKTNFSKEFRDNFAGGSEGEALIVAVILRTMAQFDEVKKVQILVEGKPIETLGHADLSQPLDVRWESSEFSEKE